MKTKMILAIAFLAAILVLPSAASAMKGVGIVWDTEVEIVDSGATRCVQYGVYNPWSEDVTAELTVSDELKSVITNAESEAKAIPANTMHQNAIPIEFCFRAPKVYPENCMLGNQFCEQTCDMPEVTYSGKIIAIEKSSGSSGTGSATAVQTAVPLVLKVRCAAHGVDWTLAYVVIIVLAITAMSTVIYKRKKKR